MKQTVNTTRRRSKESSDLVKIGYVPMTDCAPLVVAKELGLFEKYGLNVRLRREPGWATVREKICCGELDAAQAPASMVVELSLGFGESYCPCLTGFVTAHNGNAITLSNELWEMGVRDGTGLAKVVHENSTRQFVFAGVLKYSSQNYLMRHWLLAHGIHPDRDVRMVVVPPPQVHDCLKFGYLDGFCVAEPWSSVSLLAGSGWSPTLTSDFMPMHLEKVFMVTEAFHERDSDRHMALLRALYDAALYCDQPENRENLAAMLAQSEYVDVTVDALRNSLVGPFQMGKDRQVSADDAIVFHRNEANRPTLQKVGWVLDEIILHKLQPEMPRPTKEQVRSCFREDIFDSMISMPA